jgi:hypothetical protein
LIILIATVLYRRRRREEPGRWKPPPSSKAPPGSTVRVPARACPRPPLSHPAAVAHVAFGSSTAAGELQGDEEEEEEEEEAPTPPHGAPTAAAVAAMAMAGPPPSEAPPLPARSRACNGAPPTTTPNRLPTDAVAAIPTAKGPRAVYAFSPSPDHQTLKPKSAPMAIPPLPPLPQPTPTPPPSLPASQFQGIGALRPLLFTPGVPNTPSRAPPEPPLSSVENHRPHDTPDLMVSVENRRPHDTPGSMVSTTRALARARAAGSSPRGDARLPSPRRPTSEHHYHHQSPRQWSALAVDDEPLRPGDLFRLAAAPPAPLVVRRPPVTTYHL